MSIKSTINEFKSGFKDGYRRSFENNDTSISYEESLVVARTAGKMLAGVAVGMTINALRKKSLKQGLKVSAKNLVQTAGGAITGIVIINGVAKEMAVVRRRQQLKELRISQSEERINR